MSARVLRIVAASPGDVKAERTAIEEVINELNRGVAAVFSLRLELIRWETDVFPGFHSKGPQGLIDARLRIADADLLVGIFWKRFGTPVPGSQSGTQHEFEVAYQSWKRTGRPQIMMYFNQKPYMPKAKEETDQQGRVLAFRDSFPAEGLWWEYKGPIHFEKLLRNHLTQFILNHSTLEIVESALGSVPPEIIQSTIGTVKRPGGDLARRPLHFIWMIDCSSSMDGEKIQTLNFAMRETIPLLRSAAGENPEVAMLMRVISFSDGARWHIGEPTPIENFHWHDLPVGGVTDVGAALRMVAEELKVPPMPERALRPVLVLLLDGSPTDDFDGGLRILNEQAWGKKSVRIGIAVGAEADKDVLRRFMGMQDREPLEMNNPEQLLQHVRWVSTSVVGLPAIPPLPDTELGMDVW
jgi:uncharacterized protein YegL